MLLGLLSNVVAVLIGGVITWYFSRRYYEKATLDLVNEAAMLRHLSTIMLNAMEDAGFVKLNRNEEGDPTGRIIEARVVFEGGTTMTGNLEVTPDTQPPG